MCSKLPREIRDSIHAYLWDKRTQLDIELDWQSYYKGYRRLSLYMDNTEPANVSKVPCLPYFTRSNFIEPTIADEAVQMFYKNSDIMLDCTKIHPFLHRNPFGTSCHPHEHIHKFGFNIAPWIVTKDPPNWFKTLKHNLQALTTLNAARGLETTVYVDSEIAYDGQLCAILVALRPYFERMQASPTTHVDILGVYVFAYDRHIGSSKISKDVLRDVECLNDYYKCKSWEEWLQQKKELLESLPQMDRYGHNDNIKVSYSPLSHNSRGVDLVAEM